MYAPAQRYLHPTASQSMMVSTAAAALRLSRRHFRPGAGNADAWRLDYFLAGSGCRPPCATARSVTTQGIFTISACFHEPRRTVAESRRRRALVFDRSGVTNATSSSAAVTIGSAGKPTSTTMMTSARSFASASLTPDDIDEMKRQIALMNSHMKDESVAEADRLLRSLIDEELAGNAKVKLTSDFLNGTLNAYQVLSEKAADKAKLSRTRPNQAYAEKAVELLQYVEKAYGQDNAISPDAKSYGIVIDAYAKSGDPGKAEETLQRMVNSWKGGNRKLRPDTVLYSSVIDAWAKSGNKVAPRRAEALLDLMDRLSQQGYEDLRPDTITFSAVINAHAKSDEEGAAQRAENILKHMVTLFEGGREECQPNVESFNTVIDAWARSKDANAGNQAEALLKEMDKLGKTKGYENLLPDTITYSSVINSHAKSGDKRSALRAEAILGHMIKLFEGGREECRPDVTTFNTVIDAWARSKDKEAPQRAKRIIQLMKNLSKKGYNDVEPNAITYNSLMNAYAMSPIPNKAEKAFQCLKWMESEAERGNTRVAPTIYIYSAVLKACGMSWDRGLDTAKVRRIAIQTFEKLRNAPDLSVDPQHYTSLFHTIANTTKGAQNAKMMREVFRLCCQDGLMNNIILDMLRRRLPKRLFADLVGSNAPNVTSNDLPREWSRNGRRR